MRRLSALTAVLLGLAVLGGCSTSTNKASPLIGDTSIQLTSGHAVSLSTIAAGAVIIGAIYYIYDPLAPNWEIEEMRLSEDTYHFTMKMKRYHTGGAGESIQVLKRCATQLRTQNGFADYVLMEYTEGIESQTLGARRTAEGTVKLVQRIQADSFLQNER